MTIHQKIAAIEAELDALKQRVFLREQDILARSNWHQKPVNWLLFRAIDIVAWLWVAVFR